MRKSYGNSEFGVRSSEFRSSEFRVLLRTPHSALSTGAGFTLVELVLVVIIIGVLGAAILPRFVGRAEQAKVARTKADIASISLGLDLYELDIGQYPSALEELTQRDPPTGFEPEQWNGPYLKKGLPKDPWGNPYVYNSQSQHQQDYDLFSSGPDGKPGNDDITNWD